MIVQTSHDSCLPFKKRRIVEVLMDEANVKESEAFKIARSIERKMKSFDEEVISSAAIREEVNSQLRKRGMLDEARKHERVGIPVAEIKKTIGSHNTDNANVGRNPEAVHKYVADAALKQYALGCLPTDLARAHEKGDLHCHDLEFFPARPLNCLQQDLRQFIKYGLKVDGNGEHTSAAGPANNIETLVNHAGQVLMASQVFMSGGQSLPLMNVFMAPYVQGLDYERIKQAMQMLIFNLNMSYVSRGGQTVFSSVNLEFGVPEFIENEIAWGPGGKKVGVYGDYFDEAEMLRHAFTEVLIDGDSMGKPHLFPNTIYAIREESLKPEHDEAFNQVHELSAKYSTPYFTSLLNDYSGVNSNTMGSMSADTPILVKGMWGNNRLEFAGDIFSKDQKNPLEVMTYDKDGNRSWKPIKTIIEKPPAPLIKIRTKNGRTIKVTPNHKIPVKREGDFQKIKSEEIKLGDELYEFNLEPFAEIKDDPHFEFLGIFLADGYIRRAESTKHKRNSHAIEFHFQKEWKLNYLIQLLDNLSYKYEVRERKDNTWTLYVREKSIRDMFVKYYDGKDKVFPLEYLESPNELANIIKGLSFDATKSGKALMFSCSDEKLALGFMLALDFLGIRHAHHIDKRYNWKPNYQIRFMHRPSKSIVKEISWEKNDKPVYDLEIEDNHNYVCGWGNIHIENCRTRLNTNWTGDWDKDTLRTGNLAYITLNLPRMVYKGGNFYENLEETLGLAERLLLIRREHALKCMGEFNLLAFLTQLAGDEPYYRIENSTLSFGFVGMHETLLAMGIEGGITSREGQKTATGILRYINSYKDELVDETDYRWTVLQTPAESTAHRFAELDRKAYKDKAIVNGKEGSGYYTNSTHVPVDSKMNLLEKIRIEEQYHPLTSGGHITNLFTGEAHPGVEALANLTKRVAKNTDTGFFTYSSAFSYCFACNNHMRGLQDKCVQCGSLSDVEWYDRITGYIQAVGHKKEAAGGWNKGKQNELVDRERYIL